MLNRLFARYYVEALQPVEHRNLQGDATVRVAVVGFHGYLGHMRTASLAKGSRSSDVQHSHNPDLNCERLVWLSILYPLRIDKFCWPSF